MSPTATTLARAIDSATCSFFFEAATLAGNDVEGGEELVQVIHAAKARLYKLVEKSVSVR